MALTYTPIATTTLGSNTGTVTFNSIPQTYTDLVVIGNAWSNAANNTGYFHFNGDTGANYSITGINGTGSAAQSFQLSNNSDNWLGYSPYPLNTSSYPPVFILNIMNYSNTTIYKTSLLKMSSPGIATYAIVSLWRNTAAITSLNFTAPSSYYTGSTFTLYGIQAA